MPGARRSRRFESRETAGACQPGLRDAFAPEFSTGAIFPLGRRLALLEWARRKNAVIVEDDYDGEFNYEGRPLQLLQGLDTGGRMVYIGTFSRTVFPALRIGYLIVPKSLAPAFTAAQVA